MTYQEARAFLEKTKQYGSILGLESIHNLMEKLGDVQEQLRIVHVAGTNGKGSTCAMLAQILKEAGYVVGAYHSPAVFNYEEIFQINGMPILNGDYADCMEDIAKACCELVAEGKAHPTSFEVETALAFCYFWKKQCDIVVLETGMGGKEDATNLITKPICSVLTSISKDHMGFLGDTLEKIAAVKAGIIKKGCPVVTAEQEACVMQVIEKQAKAYDAPLFVVDKSKMEQVRDTEDGFEFLYQASDRNVSVELNVSLHGEFQKKNVLTVLRAVEALRMQGYQIPEAAVKRGLKRVRWQGRFEVLSKKPYIVMDGAHNEGAALELKNTIEKHFTNREIIYIIGVLADKEHEKMLKLLLPYARKVYTITPPNPRALAGECLCAEAKQLHPVVINMDSVAQALQAAVAEAKTDGMILAFGSLSYLGEMRQAVLEWSRSL